MNLPLPKYSFKHLFPLFLYLLSNLLPFNIIILLGFTTSILGFSGILDWGACYRRTGGVLDDTISRKFLFIICRVCNPVGFFVVAGGTDYLFLLPNFVFLITAFMMANTAEVELVRGETVPVTTTTCVFGGLLLLLLLMVEGLDVGGGGI